MFCLLFPGVKQNLTPLKIYILFGFIVLDFRNDPQIFEKPLSTNIYP